MFFFLFCKTCVAICSVFSLLSVLSASLKVFLPKQACKIIGDYFAEFIVSENLDLKYFFKMLLLRARRN